MKHLTQYMNEALNINDVDSEVPENKMQLYEIIKDRTTGMREGDTIDLNDIDVSNITDMSNLFNQEKLLHYNYDVSKWDVSKVKNMSWMFAKLKYFNCDISNWDVSNVEEMSYMFFKCASFDQDLSGWCVSKADYHTCSFFDTGIKDPEKFPKFKR